MNWNDDTPPDVLTVLRLSVADQLGCSADGVRMMVDGQGHLVAKVRGLTRIPRRARVQCYIEADDDG